MHADWCLHSFVYTMLLTVKWKIPRAILFHFIAMARRIYETETQTHSERKKIRSRNDYKEIVCIHRRWILWWFQRKNYAHLFYDENWCIPLNMRLSTGIENCQPAFFLIFFGHCFISKYNVRNKNRITYVRSFTALFPTFLNDY